MAHIAYADMNEMLALTRAGIFAHEGFTAMLEASGAISNLALARPEYADLAEKIRDLVSGLEDVEVEVNTHLIDVKRRV